MAGSSMRAGGIHWLATMDAGGFEKGAQRVKVEATRLQRELKAIAKMDSPFAQRTLAARAVENDKMREAERERFHKQTADNMQAAITDLSKYERASTAVVAANTKQSRSFKEINNSLKSAFGRGSDFKEFIELVSGAGAIAGIGLLANAFGNLGDNVKKATQDMARGLKTGGDVMADFIQGIPILGSVVRGGAGLLGSVQTRAGSVFGNQVAAQQAQEANTAFLKMMEAAQSRARSAGGPAAAINESARQQMSDLMRLRDTGGIGSRQFAIGADTIKREQDRLLKELEPNRLADRISDLFKTRSNTIAHWLKKTQQDVEAFNAATDARLEASTKRWGDRLQTIANTVGHAFRNLEKDRDAFNVARDKRDARRTDFIAGARGIYERLKDEQAAPLAMASGLQFGSQEEYASRVKHLLKGAVGGGDSEKELMKKAVMLQDEANKEDKRINAMFEEFYRGIKVAGPNN